MQTLITFVVFTMYALIGVVCDYLNIAHPIFNISIPSVQAVATDSCSGVFCWQSFANVIINVLNIVAYIINFVIQVFNIVLFPVSMNGLNSQTQQLLAIPLALLGGLIIFKLLRSGSGE